jgi:hypothetical protein
MSDFSLAKIVEGLAQKQWPIMRSPVVVKFSVLVRNKEVIKTYRVKCKGARTLISTVKPT